MKQFIKDLWMVFTGVIRVSGHLLHELATYLHLTASELEKSSDKWVKDQREALSKDPKDKP
jgi:hypothetical protein